MKSVNLNLKLYKTTIFLCSWMLKWRLAKCWK